MASAPKTFASVTLRDAAAQVRKEHEIRREAFASFAKRASSGELSSKGSKEVKPSRGKKLAS